MTSSYDDQIVRWIQYFPLKNFLFVEYEQMVEDPFKVIAEVEDFLGLEHELNPDNLRTPPINVADAPYDYMTLETKDKLIDYFRPHLLNFYKIVGKPFNWQLYPVTDGESAPASAESEQEGAPAEEGEAADEEQAGGEEKAEEGENAEETENAEEGEGGEEAENKEEGETAE